ARPAPNAESLSPPEINVEPHEHRRYDRGATSFKKNTLLPRRRPYAAGWSRTTIVPFANDNDVTSKCKHSSADSGVAHPRTSLLCTTILFWLCWQWLIDAARMGPRNGHVRRRNRLARPAKSYPGIGPNREFVCDGNKCADLSHGPLAWRSYLEFGCLHSNCIGARIIYLWIAYS